MEFTKTIITFTIFSVLISLSSSTSVVDYCVADLSLPETPAGYPCKNPANLTADDFVYSGFRVAGNTSASIYNFASTSAIDVTFPALNGLDLSMLRLDIGVGGVIPLHAHRASELILVIEGTIIAGFIDSDENAYYKTLNKGDIMIFPASMLHFQLNVGKIHALAFVSLNSAQPGFQFTTNSLVSNNLPTEIIRKVTLLDAQQVKKLKNIFGGTN